MMHSLPKPRAFTLVETLVAIAIVMVVLAAPFHTAEEAINASYISRDELTADGLAQEGVEYVRSIRDNNYLWDTANPASPQYSFLAGLDTTGSSPGSGTFTDDCFTNYCAIDPIDSTVHQCSNATCSAYPLELGTGSYTYPYIYNVAGASGTNITTRFYRSIKLTSLSANEVQVTVTVTWTTDGNQYTTTINEYLQNYL